MVMRYFVSTIGWKTLELLHKFVAWRWEESRAAWASAWVEPARGLRFL